VKTSDGQSAKKTIHRVSIHDVPCTWLIVAREVHIGLIQVCEDVLLPH
jgi:hypothetical protein